MKIVLILLLLCLAPSAQAYVDPGTGMLAIQGLIALVIGVVAFVRNPIQTVRGWLERWRHRNGAGCATPTAGCASTAVPRSATSRTRASRPPFCGTEWPRTCARRSPGAVRMAHAAIPRFAALSVRHPAVGLVRCPVPRRSPPHDRGRRGGTRRRLRARRFGAERGLRRHAAGLLLLRPPLRSSSRQRAPVVGVRAVLPPLHVSARRRTLARGSRGRNLPRPSRRADTGSRRGRCSAPAG